MREDVTSGRAGYRPVVAPHSLGTRHRDIAAVIHPTGIFYRESVPRPATVHLRVTIIGPCCSRPWPMTCVDSDRRFFSTAVALRCRKLLTSDWTPFI